jgi:hypothetical protein
MRASTGSGFGVHAYIYFRCLGSQIYKRCWLCNKRLSPLSSYSSSMILGKLVYEPTGCAAILQIFPLSNLNSQLTSFHTHHLSFYLVIHSRFLHYIFTRGNVVEVELISTHISFTCHVVAMRIRLESRRIWDGISLFHRAEIPELI